MVGSRSSGCHCPMRQDGHPEETMSQADTAAADAERGTHRECSKPGQVLSRQIGASEPSGGNCQAYFDLGKPPLNKKAFGGSRLN